MNPLLLFCGFIDTLNAIKLQLDGKRTCLKANKFNSYNFDVSAHALVNVVTICDLQSPAKSWFSFSNGAILIHTNLTPKALLTHLCPSLLMNMKQLGVWVRP